MNNLIDARDFINSSSLGVKTISSVTNIQIQTECLSVLAVRSGNDTTELIKFVHDIQAITPYDKAFVDCTLSYLELISLINETKISAFKNKLQTFVSKHQEYFGDYWKISSRRQFQLIYQHLQAKKLFVRSSLTKYHNEANRNFDSSFDELGEFYRVDPKFSKLTLWDFDLNKFKNNPKWNLIFTRQFRTESSFFEDLLSYQTVYDDSSDDEILGQDNFAYENKNYALEILTYIMDTYIMSRPEILTAVSSIKYFFGENILKLKIIGKLRR